jgi:hypothetical protein
MKYLILLLIVSPVVSLYHNTDTILKMVKLQCMVNPNLTCEWHDDILVVDWLKEQYPQRDELWTFNEHAREVVTAELAIDIIMKLPTMKPNKRITIIPVLNVWGRKQVDKGEKCLRKNENGVDTNRNYQIKDKHHYSKNSEEYEGEHPISEKESKLVSSILKDGVKRYINVHSGEFSMYMPYDSNTNVPPHADKMEFFLKTLSPLCPQCDSGSAAKVSSYKAYGTSVDYAIRMGVPEAYTFEIFGENTNHCEHMFNPKSYTSLLNTIRMWRRILFTVAIDDRLSTAQLT